MNVPLVRVKLLRAVNRYPDSYSYSCLCECGLIQCSWLCGVYRMLYRRSETRCCSFCDCCSCCCYSVSSPPTLTVDCSVNVFGTYINVNKIYCLIHTSLVQQFCFYRWCGNYRRYNIVIVLMLVVVVISELQHSWTFWPVFDRGCNYWEFFLLDLYKKCFVLFEHNFLVVTILESYGGTIAFKIFVNMHVQRVNWNVQFKKVCWDRLTISYANKVDTGSRGIN